MERRSLDGMVIFLTRFFPYLADSEAERYLLLADADLLVATRIIVMDRRMKRFGSSERATEEAFRMALKCAALAARHPDPDRLVGSWLTISNRLDEAVRLGAKVRRRSPSSSLHSLARLLDGPPWRPAEGVAARGVSSPSDPPRAVPAHQHSPETVAPGRDPWVLPAGPGSAAGRRAAVPLPPQPAQGRPLLRPARSIPSPT
ncbi:uncharacterized protein LOC101786805 [Setaria italica]|uniref:uncharacterized protein LOC101786805 n=1 Tax=Setaria italica TaxID=4555 RepID=UPI000BE58095|nr:uncharacterized protein LOC101786805 [Setaria italica]